MLILYCVIKGPNKRSLILSLVLGCSYQHNVLVFFSPLTPSSLVLQRSASGNHVCRLRKFVFYYFSVVDLFDRSVGFV